MRKLLLATVAVLGASMGVAAVADAQTPSPAPGTVTVRLNGRMRFYGYFTNDRDADNNAAGSANTPLTTANLAAGTANGNTANVNAVGNGPLGGTNKQANYGFGDYIRLYPGFDGVAANGLKYGASIEIRQDQVSGAGGGVYGSISQQDRARSALYVRREWGYLGTDQLGTIRVGSVDGPSSLYMTGNFENFNDGGLNGDVPALISSSITSANWWPFSDVGNMYTTNKIIYLSPQLYGLDLGVAYEPSTANVSINSGFNCTSGGPDGTNFTNALGAIGGNGVAAGANNTGSSGPGCDRLSSSPSNAESARRRNTIDALLRYRGSFAGFGIAATAGYITGGHVLDNSGIAFNNNAAAGALRPSYDGLNLGDFGLALTYGGLTVGGKYQFGRFTGQWGLVPKGLPDSEAVLVGASYTIGPVIVGAHGLLYKESGDLGNAFFGRQRREVGIAAGGTYTLAPGVSLFLSYLYNERKQNGFNFITGQGVTAAAPQGNAFSNKVSANLISIGTSFSW